MRRFLAHSYRPVLVLLVSGALLPAGPRPVAAQATVTGISRDFNPAISVNGLFLGAFFRGEPFGAHEGETTGEESHGHGIEEGLSLQEAEIQFTSFVDPYFMADIILGFGEHGAEVETAFLSSQALPAGLTLVVGRTYAPLGKHNQLHTHLFPFVEAPLIHTGLLGEEGLAETGAELSWLAPTPFYLRLLAAVYDGDNEFFASPQARDLVGLGRVNTLWDLSESTTLELGGSFVGGRSGLSSAQESILGGDVTFKWRPLRRAVYTQLEWQAEYLQGSRLPEVGEDEPFGGLSTHLRYRFRRSWWLGVRYEETGLPGETVHAARRYALQLAWAPGEFEAWRLQYSHTEPLAGGPTAGALLLQATFTIGSHPAHSY